LTSKIINAILFYLEDKNTYKYYIIIIDNLFETQKKKVNCNTFVLFLFHFKVIKN